MDCGDPTRGAMVNLHLINPKWFCQLVGFSNFIMLSSFSAPYARPCSAPALPRLPAGGKDRRKRRTGGKGTEGGKGRQGGRGRKGPTRGARADLPPKQAKSCCQLVFFWGLGLNMFPSLDAPCDESLAIKLFPSIFIFHVGTAMCSLAS